MMFARIGPTITIATLGFLIVANLFGSSAMSAEQTRKASPTHLKPTPSAKLAAPSMTQASYSLTPGFSVKRSDVVVPADVPLGQYRRVTQPFPNWTLICDEDLSKKQKVCNVSQTIVDANVAPRFSWSLAAAKDGQPYFILRVPPDVGARGKIGLDLEDGGPLLLVPIKGCNETVCLAYQPVGQRLRVAVEKEALVQVSYLAGSPPKTVSFRAPLKGLASALAVI